jgi:hypothetical protein
VLEVTNADPSQTFGNWNVALGSLNNGAAHTVSVSLPGASTSRPVALWGGSAGVLGYAPEAAWTELSEDVGATPTLQLGSAWRSSAWEQDLTLTNNTGGASSTGVIAYELLVEGGEKTAAIANTLPALTQDVQATHTREVTDWSAPVSETTEAEAANEAAIASTLPALTQAVVVSMGPFSAEIAHTLPALTQAIAISQAVVTDWSAEASATTESGVATKVLVVTVGV